MKQILLFLLLVFSSFFQAQELKYEDVVKVDSTTTKEELFNRARTWIAKNLKDEGEKFTIDDKKLGEITGGGKFRYYTKKIYVGALCTIGYVNFKINIYPKDGRYKYVIHSLVHEGTDCRRNSSINYGLLTTDEMPDKSKDVFLRKGPWNDIKDKTEIKANLLIQDLKEHMSKNHETKNDW
nr:DUF4468 domain-containing protein [uncultured Chryseobacterium sp.]